MRIHVYAIRNTYQQQQQKFPACKWNEGSVVALLQQGERGGLRFRESQSSRGSKVTLDQQPLRPALLRYECLLCAWRRGLKSSLYEAENGERKKKRHRGGGRGGGEGVALKGQHWFERWGFWLAGVFWTSHALCPPPQISLISLHLPITAVGDPWFFTPFLARTSGLALRTTWENLPTS